MEDNNNIDDIFRSGLDDMEMEPSARNWDSLSSKLEAKRIARSRRKRGLWFSAAAFLLILTYGTFKMVNRPAPVTPQPIQQETESIATPPVNTENSSLENTVPEQGNSVSETENMSTQNTTVNGESNSANENNVEQNINSSATTQSTGNVIQTKEQHATVNSHQANVPAAKPTSGKNIIVPTVAEKIQPAKMDGTTAVQPKEYVSSDKVVPTENIVETNQPESKQITNKESSETTKAESTKTAIPEVIAVVPVPSTVSTQIDKTNNAADQKTSDNKTSDNSTNSNTSESSAPENANRSVSEPTQVKTSSTENSDQQNTPSTVSPATESSAPVTTSSASADKSSTGSANDSVPSPTKLNDFAAQENPNSTSLLKRVISHLSFEAYYTPEYVSTALRINHDYVGPASQNLNDYKNEKSQYSYSLGANVRYDVGSHWSFASGISTSSYSKSAVYNTISVISDSVYQEQYINAPGGHQGGGSNHHHHHNGGGQGGNGGGSQGGGGGGHGHPNPGHPNDPNSNHHYIIHTPCGSIDLNNIPPQASNATNGDTLNIKTETFQTVKFINVPFVVRYTFGANKFSWFVETGAALNYVTKDNVRVVVNDATTEDNTLDALSKFNYSFLFGFGGQYNFYKGLGMFIKPSMRYSITPISVDSPVNSYPHYFGVSAGINLHF